MRTKVFLLIILTIATVTYFYTINSPNNSITSNIVPTTEPIPEVKQETEVIDYVQTYIPQHTKSGSCWISSIATPSNPKAWRCSSRNYIYDPCFEVSNDKVVCDINPENDKSGFTLNLTDKLPDNTGRPVAKETHSWKYKLSNGLICDVLTGAAGSIGGLNGKLYFYVCDKNAVIPGNLDKNIDKSKPLWQTTVVYLEDGTEDEIRRETVSVLKVWK